MQHDEHAHGAEIDTLPSDEARNLCSGAGLTRKTSEQLDSAARAKRDQRDRAITTATASAALAGFTMHVLPGDGGGAVFLLTGWNLTRELPDLVAVAAFLDHVRARHA